MLQVTDTVYLLPVVKFKNDYLILTVLKYFFSLMFDFLTKYFQALETVANPVMTKPKPKVEPPKEDKKEEQKGSGDAEKKEGEENTDQNASQSEPVKPDMDVD